MKVPTPKLYVPYGPVGHPEAQFHMDFADISSSEAEGEFWSWLDRHSIQGDAPSMFFRDDLSLAEQGYYMLLVVGGEVSDELMAKLESPRIYTPVKEGEPGRKLEEFKAYLPSFTHLEDREVWEAGQEGCDHDIGLESWDVVYKTVDGKKYSMSESYGLDTPGEYYVTVTCSRCGAKHAYREYND